MRRFFIWYENLQEYASALQISKYMDTIYASDMWEVYMKNQYVGDIGDYGNMGMLRILQNAGFRIGVNWYLTPNDNSKDGRHIHYLDKPCDTPDPYLHKALAQLVSTECRNISGLEAPDLLPGAVFYNEVLDYSRTSHASERKVIRHRWDAAARERLKDCDLVFLDPDNGLEVKSTRPYHMPGNKYVTYEEAKQYYAEGKSVLIYNHRDRSPEERYIERFRRFSDFPGTAHAHLKCLTFRRVSVRDYVLLSQMKHLNRLQFAMNDIFGSSWAKYFSYRAL